MCISDWRIGRLIRPIGHVVDLAATLTLQANFQRVGLRFSVSSSTAIPLGNIIRIAFDGTMEVYLPDTQGSLLMTLQSDGDLPTRQITVTLIAGSDKYSVIEYIMPEAYLAAGLEHFNSEYKQWKG